MAGSPIVAASLALCGHVVAALFLAPLPRLILQRLAASLIDDGVGLAEEGGKVSGNSTWVAGPSQAKSRWAGRGRPAHRVNRPPSYLPPPPPPLTRNPFPCIFIVSHTLRTADFRTERSNTALKSRFPQAADGVKKESLYQWISQHARNCAQKNLEKPSL